MDLKVGLPILGLALGVGLWVARPHAAAVHPQSKKHHVELGPNNPAHRVPGASEIAPTFPAFAALSPDLQKEAAIDLGGVPAPCVPCQPSIALSRCALDHPKGCENLPALVSRAVKMVAAGADTDTVLHALSYGDAWIPGVSPVEATGPVPVDLWIDPSGPFLAEIAQAVQTTTASPDGIAIHAHMLAPTERKGVAAGAAATWAADQQGQLLPFLRALATARGKSKAPTSEAQLVAAAAQVPTLDRARWDADRASAAATTALAQDQAHALAWGVRAAPTWFVNGYRMRGLQSTDALTMVIHREAEDRTSGKAP